MGGSFVLWACGWCLWAIRGRWPGLTGLNWGCGFQGAPLFSPSAPGNSPSGFSGQGEVGSGAGCWAGGGPHGAGLDPAMPSRQALAGPGLHDPLHHGAAGHAEAAGGVVAVPAQLPTGHDLLLGRAGARPAAAEGHLPAQPHAGGECPGWAGLPPPPSSSPLPSSLNPGWGGPPP